MRGPRPEQQRRDREDHQQPRAGSGGQGVHGQRGDRGRDLRAGRPGRTGPGPRGRADQQRGRHHRPLVPGRRRHHDRVDRQDQLARTLLGKITDNYHHAGTGS